MKKRQAILAHLLLGFIMGFNLLTCKSYVDTNFRKNYYYSFHGFDSSKKSEELLISIQKMFQANDYMINDQNMFISIPRDTIVSKEYLDFYHPTIHRIQIYNKQTKYKLGAVHIEVINKTSVNGGLQVMQFIRYSYTEEKNWKLDFDLGDHYFYGLPHNNNKLRLKLIAGEIARVSFK